MSEETKILLSEKEMPKQWYNLRADLPTPMEPPLNPQTKKPLEPDDLAAIFPKSLIEQELTTERWIDIPEEVLKIYAKWRPSPLIRANRLEQALGTPAKIYYKYEGVSGAGSHKPNTAVPQAYFNMKEGIHRLATETGAGQWGSALAMACAFFGLECTICRARMIDLMPMEIACLGTSSSLSKNLALAFTVSSANATI
jgi:tryptophan synthase beta chain